MTDYRCNASPTRPWPHRWGFFQWATARRRPTSVGTGTYSRLGKIEGDDMSLEVERIMEALRALAKDTTRRESQRFVAAEQAIKTWLSQTKDLAKQEQMLRELDDEIAEEMDDFRVGLHAHITRLLKTLADRA